jgi:hypothetical protein
MQHPWRPERRREPKFSEAASTAGGQREVNVMSRTPLKLTAWAALSALGMLRLARAYNSSGP